MSYLGQKRCVVESLIDAYKSPYPSRKYPDLSPISTYPYVKGVMRVWQHDEVDCGEASVRKARSLVKCSQIFSMISTGRRHFQLFCLADRDDNEPMVEMSW